MEGHLRLGSASLRHLCLTHSDLDFYVDVTGHKRDERFMATADLAEDSRMWVSGTRRRRPSGLR
jgi:hypothetical protein